MGGDGERGLVGATLWWGTGRGGHKGGGDGEGGRVGTGVVYVIKIHLIFTKSILIK